MEIHDEALDGNRLGAGLSRRPDDFACRRLAPVWGPHRDGVSLETGLRLPGQRRPAAALTSDRLGLGLFRPGDCRETDSFLAPGESDYLVAFDLEIAKGAPMKELWARQDWSLFQWKGNSWNKGTQCESDRWWRNGVCPGRFLGD